jgi:hypothetical protein
MASAGIRAGGSLASRSGVSVEILRKKTGGCAAGICPGGLLCNLGGRPHRVVPWGRSTLEGLAEARPGLARGRLVPWTRTSGENKEKQEPDGLDMEKGRGGEASAGRRFGAAVSGMADRSCGSDPDGRQRPSSSRAPACAAAGAMVERIGQGKRKARQGAPMHGDVLGKEKQRQVQS